MADATRKRWPAAEIGLEGQEIATTADGRDITRPWVQELLQARDPRLLSAIDWGIYDQVLKDPEVMSTFQQRRRAVVAADWDVLAGDDADPRSVAAAEAHKAMIQRVGWDNITEKMLFAIFFGYSVAELVWEYRDGLIDLDRVKVRHARRFRLDKDGQLRLLTVQNMRGQVLEPRKFWMLTSGGSDDDEPYGRGLAEWLFWPTYLKREGIGFWSTALDKFGTPTAVGTYRRGTPRADQDKLLDALEAIATASGITLPEGLSVQLLEAAKSSGGDFEKMVRYMDETIAKVVLSQTMTTSDGASLSQAEVHAGVKKEVVSGDADLLNASWNAGPARWWTDINFGEDVASPIVTRPLEEEEDLGAAAETDTKLKALGWERDEESFKDKYGDGYKPAPKPAAPAPGKPAIPAPANDLTDPAAQAEQARRRAVAFAALDPQPLYVCRRLKNADALIAWAKRQGFTSTVPADEMHVTITYSRRAVDWFAMGGTFGPPTGDVIVPAGGARVVAPLGSEGAIVLAFSAEDLAWRHQQMVDAGASWDYPEYRPHVTITYDGTGVDLDKVEPYIGQLVFGPEIFEAIDTDWKSGITETSFAAGDLDVVDQTVAELLDDAGDRLLDPIMGPIADAIMKSGSAGELDQALIGALGQADVDKLTEALARAGFAVRLDAIVEGEGGE